MTASLPLITFSSLCAKRYGGLSAPFHPINPSQKYRLHGTMLGLHEYVQVMFHEAHFCTAGMMVHSVLKGLVCSRLHPLN